MDHSTLSTKKCGKHIPANQQLYFNEAKSGKNIVYNDLPEMSVEPVRVDWFIMAVVRCS